MNENEQCTYMIIELEILNKYVIHDIILKKCTQIVYFICGRVWFSYYVILLLAHIYQEIHKKYRLEVLDVMCNVMLPCNVSTLQGFYHNLLNQ